MACPLDLGGAARRVDTPGLRPRSACTGRRGSCRERGIARTTRRLGWLRGVLAPTDTYADQLPPSSYPGQCGNRGCGLVSAPDPTAPLALGAGRCNVVPRPKHTLM